MSSVCVGGTECGGFDTFSVYTVLAAWVHGPVYEAD